MTIKALIYGLQSYTDTWARVKRGYRGFEMLPASNLDRLSADLAKYPKLRLVAVACWNEIICEKVTGLHVAETLGPVVSEVFDLLLQVARENTLKVILVNLRLPVVALSIYGLDT